MFNHVLSSGAVKRLNSLLKDPLRFDSIEFVSSNTEEILKLPSSINDIYIMCNAFEAVKGEVYPLMSNVIHQLGYTVGLIGDKGVIPDYLPVHAELPSPTQDEIHALNMYRIDVVNQQIERLHELFSIKECLVTKNELPQEVSRAIELFMFSEHMYFVFYGLAVVKQKNSTFIFSANHMISNSFFKSKWFANFWESSSYIANLSYFNMIPNDLSVFEANAYLSDIHKVYLDKIFSINSRYISGEFAKTEVIKAMIVICKIITVLFYVKFKQGRDHAFYEDFFSLGVSIDDIEMVKNINNSMDGLDRLLRFKHGDSIEIANPCVSIRSRRLIESLVKILNSRRFDEIAGDHFEKEYIAKYILRELNDEYTRFKLHGSIISEQVLPNNPNGDVDIILEDTIGERYFFLQIKYLRNAGKPFIRGDVEYLTNNKIYHGITQLTHIKEYHSKGLLHSFLKKRGIEKCTPENTIYILVTNVTNLDFQKDESSGVVFYEWNTLRNLLLDGRCLYGDTKNAADVMEWRYNSPLPLNEPSKVIDILVENSPALRTVRLKQLFRAKDMITMFSMGGVECKSVGLGM